MGVDLGDLSVKHPISLESLSGKTLAVDAFNMLYQFLASIRQEDGTPLMDFKGNVTAHLSGLFYRCARFRKNGIRPVFVFDGEAPKFKKSEQTRRKAQKKEALKKWKEALEDEKLEDARKYAQATSKLTSEMIEESKKLLDGMGIPWIQAPSEAEAQAAIMVQKGLAYATASQDYDALLFGSPILLRNLSITGRRKVPRQDRFIIVQPEEIKLPDVLKELELTREQLVLVGILSGTDFNKGVFRVGPKTALKIVKKEKTLENVKKYVSDKYEHEFEVDIQKITDFFLNPPYNEVQDKFVWNDFDKTAVMKLLVEDHDFSEERVSKTLDDMIEEIKEKGAQKRLDQFF